VVRKRWKMNLKTKIGLVGVSAGLLGLLYCAGNKPNKVSPDKLTIHSSTSADSFPCSTEEISPRGLTESIGAKAYIETDSTGRVINVGEVILKGKFKSAYEKRAYETQIRANIETCLGNNPEYIYEPNFKGYIKF
jgi:hypothetical protein